MFRAAQVNTFPLQSPDLPLPVDQTTTGGLDISSLMNLMITMAIMMMMMKMMAGAISTAR